MKTPNIFSHGKRLAVMVHDLATTPLAIALALYLAYPESARLKVEALVWIVPLFTVYAGFVYRYFRLYEAKWRFASLPDLFNIFRATCVLAITLVVVDLAMVARDLVHGFVFGEKVCFLYGILQMLLLGGPRIAYRYWRYVQARRAGEREDAPSILVLGRATEAEIVLRSLEEGMRKRFAPRGILSPRASDRGATIRGVPVLGDYDDLERIVAEANEEGRPLARLVFAPSEFASGAESERLVATARQLGIALSRLQTVEFGGGSSLTPVDIEDLLFRSTVEIDRARLGQFIRGRRVVITGGGGSIGSEICACVAALGAADLLVVDNSEPALFAIGETLARQYSGARVRLTVADVRDRNRIATLFAEFKPDIVFHAAALKQLPQLELDWAEGIKTNVLGTANVVDAAVAINAAAVLISTDKAVDPVSILGVTKRLSEMYGQLVDGGPARAGAPRIISVRFGNVLGSVGSVVPKFKAQIERGGPVTVTHPDMVRYFMTVREAVDLVISAAAHAASGLGVDTRASVYVLKMGQPARILDLAERMIRLAGYEPRVDIDIVFTGVRNGERMNEYLFASDEPVVDVGVEGFTAAQTPPVDRASMARWLTELANAAQSHDRATADRVFAEAVPSYKRGAPRIAASVTDLAAHRASLEAERLRSGEGGAGARD
jgi:FlaA1/EpsC-like NDP-sugar epimerase